MDKNGEDVLRRHLQLKEQMDRARRDADRAEGALKQILAELKKEYSVTSLEEAEDLLEELERQEPRQEAALRKALDDLERQGWSGKLRGDE